MEREKIPAYRLIPAARFHLLTPAFDLVCALMGLGSRFKERVVRTAQIPLNARVLEAGCGTGTLALMVKFGHPDVEVIGLDADPRVLTLARRKAARDDLDVKFFEGCIEAMPFPDESFDLVFSTLVLHHLPGEVKAQACREMFRVLRPGGRVIIADFAPPQGWPASLVAAILGGFRLERTAENFAGRIPSMLHEAGFIPVHEVFHTAWSITCLEAWKDLPAFADRTP
jgi:ubiquinone/menaquinone biosynthesis C-methylase UbiE